MGRQDHRRQGVQMARSQGDPFVHFGHRGGHASGGGEHPTSEGRGNGRWTALGESVHAIQVTDGRLEARSDRLVGRARGAEIDGDTCCEPRATARGRGGRRRGTLAPGPSGRRRRLDGRSERAAQARSRGRPRSHASSRDDVGRPWRGPYERAATGLGVVQVRSGSAVVARLPTRRCREARSRAVRLLRTMGARPGGPWRCLREDGARRYGAACGRPKRADSEAHGFSSLRWNSSGLSASRKLSSFAGRPAASSLTSTKSRVLVTSTSR